MKEWIKLSEQKPEQGGIYLACNDDDIAICGYWPHLDKKNEWGSVETDRLFKPTHWMSLPLKPEDDE